MGRQSGKENIKKSCAGLLAHVDAGKTTLSESMLLSAGVIRKGGRVDHGDSFLDYDAQERSRGITIFSKQAILTWKGTEFTFIDTPGHVDFSAEMERTLSVLDYAVVLHQRSVSQSSSVLSRNPSRYPPVRSNMTLMPPRNPEKTGRPIAPQSR